MSFKPYLIPLSARRGVKQIQSKANKTRIDVIHYGVVRSKAGQKYNAVSIDRHYGDVKKIYGKGVKFTGITRADIERGNYKYMYERKARKK